MKKLTILSIIVAVATLSLSAADNAGGKKQHGRKPIPADVLAKYDKNKDGKVDKKDGLTEEEMKAFRGEMKKAPEAPAAK